MGEHEPPSKSIGDVAAVLFDAVGTLIRPARSIAETYGEAAHRHGIELPLDEINSRFREAFAKQEQLDTSTAGGRTSEQREVQRWEDIVAEVFGPSPNLQPLFEDLWNHFALPEAWAVDPAAEHVISQIRFSGRVVGVASNFDGRLRTISGAFPALKDGPLFISSELGWRKPRAEFFESIENVLALPASNLLMVGDDFENDYFGATRSGWQAILLHRNDRGSAATPIEPRPELQTSVACLSDVLAHLL